MSGKCEFDGTVGSEANQDASSALTDLDKTMRTDKVGEQCECIVRFPRHFARYPFPVVINSAFLKLADCFRGTQTNFIRLCILHVCQQSERHLDKIINVDEFVRRMFAVLHCNDPVARALTLSTLGSIAVIIPERKDVHHCVRNALDSNEPVELEAAIYAATRFARYSKTFSTNICEKISEMMEGLAHPVETKLKLLPVFQHMHHDAQAAQMVRELCIRILPSSPAQNFLVMTLNTLTKLAAATLIDIPDQVDLLISYVRQDPRRMVKLKALCDLQHLSLEGSHLWNEKSITSIVDFGLETNSSAVQMGTLSVLASIAKNGAVAKFDLEQESSAVQLCMKCCYSTDVQLAAKAVSFVTFIALERGSEWSIEASLAIESLLMIMVQQDVQDDILPEFQSVLTCAVKLGINSAEDCEQIVKTLGVLLKDTSGESKLCLCKAIAALGNQRPDIVRTLFREIIQSCDEMLKEDMDKVTQQTLVVLLTIIFQVMEQWEWPQKAKQTLEESVEKLNMWSVYRLVRQAARYGQHKQAAELLRHLTNQVASEHFFFWLVALMELCDGEACLMGGNSDVRDSINDCVNHYLKGISALKSASTPSWSLSFQCTYAQLRCGTLQAHSRLLDVLCCLRTAPPPAIAASTSSSMDIMRAGRITTELRKVAEDYKSLASSYVKLCECSFDADPVTLNNLQVLQQTNTLMAESVEFIANKTTRSIEEIYESFCLETKGNVAIEVTRMINASKKAYEYLKDLRSEGMTVSSFDLTCFRNAVRSLVEVSLSFPRYMFQAVQSTVIKLAISPQPKTPGDAINVQNNSQLAIKVEGIIQHGERPGLFREVEELSISVNSHLQTKSAVTRDMKGEKSLQLVKQVKPHNDFFMVQFLLAFSIPGTYQLTLDTSVVDKQGVTWRTGPRTQLSVKFYEDVTSKQVASTSAPWGTARM